MKNQRGLRGAYRLVLSQLGLTLFLSLLMGVTFSIAAAKSASLGGFVSLIPNAYFARKLFQHHGAHAARNIVGSFYKGEAIKIVLSMILFAMVFLFCKIIPWVFFTVYILVQMVFWFAPLLFDN